MIFFSQKEKVGLEQFTTSFYNNYLPFEEPSLEFFRILKNQIAYVDKPFASFDFNIFLTQMAAIRLECFGLAMYYKLGDNISIENNLVTEKYLTSRDILNVWDDLGTYNSFAAKSATHGADPSTMKGRARISLINTTRVELFKKYHFKGFNDVCIARALNRFGTSIELAVQYLILNLTKMLAYDLNEEATSILISKTFDFYILCASSLKKVKIVE